MVQSVSFGFSAGQQQLLAFLSPFISGCAWAEWTQNGWEWFWGEFACTTVWRGGRMLQKEVCRGRWKGLNILYFLSICHTVCDWVRFLCYQARSCTLTIFNPSTPVPLSSINSFYCTTQSVSGACLMVVFAAFSLMATDSICYSPTFIHRVSVEGQSVSSFLTDISHWLAPWYRWTYRDV